MRKKHRRSRKSVRSHSLRMEPLEQRLVLSATLHVDPAGDDVTGTGTAADPWQTIQHAVTSVAVNDTVLIHEGTYREQVRIEQDGITLKSTGDGRVIVTGSDDLNATAGSWTSLANNVYSKDVQFGVNRTPTSLYLDGEQSQIARTEGWWRFDSGSDRTHLVDAGNLAGKNYVGATVFYRQLQHPNGPGGVGSTLDSRAVVTAHSGSTITTGSDLISASGSNPAQPNHEIDYYYLFGHKDFLNEGGEWAHESIGNNTFRIYLKLDAGQTPSDHLIEYTVRNNAIQLGGWSSEIVGTPGADNVTIDGLEVRHSLNAGIATLSETTNSNGTVNNAGQVSDNLTIKNTVVYSHNGLGISLQNSDNSKILNSIVTDSKAGITINRNSDGVTVKNSEVYGTAEDGITIYNDSDNAIIEANYIHDNAAFAHPDSIQFDLTSDNFTVKDNLIVQSGQSVIFKGPGDQSLPNSSGATFDNNLIVGSLAVSLTSEDFDNITFNDNTIALSGASMTRIPVKPGTGRTQTNNIFYSGGHGTIYGINQDQTNITSSNNGFYHFVGGTGAGGNSVGNTVSWYDAGGTVKGSPQQVWTTVSVYNSVTGKESGSDYGNPNFGNAPSVFVVSTEGLSPLATKNRVYFANSSAGAHSGPKDVVFDQYEVGDYIEIDFDGVKRQITSVVSENLGNVYGLGHYIEWDTPLDETPFKSVMMSNWKTNNTTVDLDFQTSNTTRGSDVVFANYKIGDFNGNGQSELPFNPLMPTTTTPPTGSGTVASDDFSSNSNSGGTGWVAGSSWNSWNSSVSFSSGKASYSTSGGTMHRSVELTGSSSAEIQFNITSGIASTSNQQIAYLEVSEIGSNAVVGSLGIRANTLGANGEFTFSLSGLTGEHRIKINSTNNGAVFDVDDIVVTGAPTTTTPPTGSGTVASDDFSSNSNSGGTGWVSGSSWSSWNSSVSFSSGKASYSTSGGTMHRNVELTGSSSAELQFNIASEISSTSNQQIGYLEITDMGSNSVVGSFVIRANSLGANGEFTFSLSGLTGEHRIKINSTNNGAVFNVDDIVVTGGTTTTPPTTTAGNIASDDFGTNSNTGGTGWDNGSWSTWSAAGGNGSGVSFSGGKADFVTTGAVMHRNVDLTNFTNASLTFSITTAASSTSHTQIGGLQVGSTYIAIYSDELGPNGEFTFDMSSFSGVANIKFSSTNNGLAFSIDDISVSGTAN